MTEDRSDELRDWYAEDDPDGAALLDELHAAFGRYVVFPSPEAHDATVLWCAATHGQQAWEHAPRLTPISPEKRCGKSRLMDVAEAVCHDVLITVNASTAAVVRSITDDDPPTLMVDEADTIFGTRRVAENNEDVRGILNAGHQRNRPYVRWDVMSRSREQCPTFAMAMLAGIGNLPDTIMDRAVPIRMRRRGPGEKVAPFRTRRDAPALRNLRNALHNWIRGNMDVIKSASPKLPVEDRAADTWEPLVIVADLAGGDWPDRSRRACKVMTGDEPDDEGVGIRLLADLRCLWPANEDHMFTASILEGLHKIEESPWSEWGRKSEPLNARGLAKLLKPYEVRSRTVRIGEETSKGYARADLTDPWTRYVPNPTQASQRHSNDETDVNHHQTSDNERDGCVSDCDSESVTRSDQRQRTDCDAVTDVTEYMPGVGPSRSGNGQPPLVLCSVCEDPILYADDQAAGYHTDRTACVKAASKQRKER